MPEGNIHIIDAELGALPAARKYAALLESMMPFDLVLLGLGEDGHTASLFPGHEHDETESVHAVHQAPKPPPERVSLSIQALSRAHKVLFLVAGSGKSAAIQQWSSGDPLPAAAVAAASASSELLLDQAAAGG